MSRKNIFEMVAEVFDLPKELARMRRLFEQELIVGYNYGRRASVLDYVKKEGFSGWKNRGRCVDVDDYFSLLDYKVLWATAVGDLGALLTLIEIVYNFWYITDRKTSLRCLQASDGWDFVLLKKIMDECLAQYNYKGKYFPELQQLIVIEDKPEATAVAEIVESNLSHKVLRYNHYVLKGNLQAKKDILLALGADLEPKRDQIKALDAKLEDGIFYILNNLHLRHNNKTEGDKWFKQAVADMDNATLEYWYDELYPMMLLAYLQLDQVERNKNVKLLKQTITP